MEKNHKTKTLKEIYDSLSLVISKAETGKAEYKDCSLVINAANSMIRTANFGLKLALLANRKPDLSILGKQ